jgi:hypothetical protein
MPFAAVHESAIGTKQTSRVALHMSAFGGKADIRPDQAGIIVE